MHALLRIIPYLLRLAGLQQANSMRMKMCVGIVGDRNASPGSWEPSLTKNGGVNSSLGASARYQNVNGRWRCKHAHGCAASNKLWHYVLYRIQSTRKGPNERYSPVALNCCSQSRKSLAAYSVPVASSTSMSSKPQSSKQYQVRHFNIKQVRPNSTGSREAGSVELIDPPLSSERSNVHLSRPRVSMVRNSPASSKVRNTSDNTTTISAPASQERLPAKNAIVQVLHCSRSQ